jgi:hypothetical protein
MGVTRLRGVEGWGDRRAFYHTGVVEKLKEAGVVASLETERVKKSRVVSWR